MQFQCIGIPDLSSISSIKMKNAELQKYSLEAITQINVLIWM